MKAWIKDKGLAWLVNWGYVIGWVVFGILGYAIWYFLITTILAIILFHKPLWAFMKMGSEIYVDWCKRTSKKTIGKLKPKSWQDENEQDSSNNSKN